MLAAAVRRQSPRVFAVKQMMETSRSETVQNRMTRLMAAVAEMRDAAAFEDIYAYMFPRLRSHMRKMTKDRTMADELTQEVMLSVWRKAHLYDPNRAQVSTWIFRIARNLYIDTLRRRMPEFDENDPAFVPEEAPSADRLLVDAQDADALRRALGQLKEEHLEVLRLSYFEEMPHSAIASALGIPLGTVKSRIRMACEKLRWVLQHTTR
ncbi:sigma-70 family RNA polymerase sigma factor [Rhizobium sp. 2MFCol3.1]|uniref:sigma-70 family RNA polymerase sigma factor n=1 Tax=Rhizobium sp. 2MFCol3.1 TaxID=1246459 RepID=UPI001FD8BABB|nr:sigma-70 family RNA polymerase sigma factor [Rhizobium sp. 2MFCol3.1]